MLSASFQASVVNLVLYGERRQTPEKKRQNVGISLDRNGISFPELKRRNSAWLRIAQRRFPFSIVASRSLAQPALQAGGRRFEPGTLHLMNADSGAPGPSSRSWALLAALWVHLGL